MWRTKHLISFMMHWKISLLHIVVKIFPHLAYKGDVLYRLNLYMHLFLDYMKHHRGRWGVTAARFHGLVRPHLIICASNVATPNGTATSPSIQVPRIIRLYPYRLSAEVYS